MAISTEQSNEIKHYLLQKIRQKLKRYNPETNSMPFHYRLLGRDRMALFSFIHSVNTTLGVSIFEQVAAMIAKPHAKKTIGQYTKLEGFISSKAVLTIDNIMRELRAANRKPNKLKETEEILAIASQGKQGKTVKKRVDLFMEMKDSVEYYFELKTAKPNINEFNAMLDFFHTVTSLSN